MVIGVPTIKRERESYLSRTLQSLIDSLDENESMDCLIVVMVCEVCKAQFPLPELTARVDGWPVSITRQLG